MLGDIESKPWDYRTLPNKMLELVKNVGDMQQEGTGYFTDSESEMLINPELLELRGENEYHGFDDRTD